MRKRTFIIAACLFARGLLIAQQDPQYSQYMFDKLAINPAFAGSSPVLNGSAAYRKQFIGFEGAPVTQKVTFHAPIQSRYMGLGMRAYHDQTGAARVTSVNGAYSYHLGFGSGKLSLGLEAGVINHSIDFSGLVRTDPVDNALSNSRESKLKPDATFGVYYHTENFYIGSSAFHLFGSKLDMTSYSRTPVTRLSRHLFTFSGYYIEVNEKFGVEPSFLLKYVGGAPAQLDMNTNVIWDDMISAGVSYRTGDAISLLFRYKIKDQYVIGYSYDMTISGLKLHSSGAHEIMLSYRLKLLPPAREKVTSPRYYF